MLFAELFIVPLLAAAVVAYCATPFVIKLAWRWGLIDDPKKNRHPKVLHTEPTPRAGGLAIYIGILVAALIFLPLDKHLSAILLGATLLLVMGLLDDRHNLNPYVRLIVQFVAASLPIFAGIGIAFVTNPMSGGTIDLSQPRIQFEFLGEVRNIWILSDLFALFWIVTLMNFINWGAKGVDGQLSGVIAIAAITIAILSLSFSADIAEWPIVVLAAITAGAYLGFLPWHIFPQKIMPGFSGSNLAGFLLGVLSILTTTKVGTLFLVLSVPLIDSGYTVIRRVLSGKSPVWGDRGHLHHRLLDIGWKKSQVAYFYWAITAALGIVSLTISSQYKLYTIFGLAIFLGGLIIWLAYHKH